MQLCAKFLQPLVKVVAILVLLLGRRGLGNNIPGQVVDDFHLLLVAPNLVVLLGMMVVLRERPALVRHPRDGILMPRVSGIWIKVRLLRAWNRSVKRGLVWPLGSERWKVVVAHDRWGSSARYRLAVGTTVVLDGEGWP